MANRKSKIDNVGEGMAVDDRTNIPSPFDVRTIKDLIALMSRHDLSEIDLRQGEVRIRLRRGVPAPVLAPSSSGAAAPASPAPDKAKQEKTLIPIKSPTPGTFYAAASPETEPFVHVGSRVSPTTAVCIIEAMKMLNEIQAECSGVIAEVLVENQQPVEYGQVLFRVDPAG